MSNVIQFHSKPRAGAPDVARRVDAGSAAEVAALRAGAREAFVLLAGRLELAMHHARAIETRMIDPRQRQEFADQIEFTQRLLDVAHQKILLL